MPNVLVIDNIDSFVFNLVDEFARRGCSVQVHRNTITTARALELLDCTPTPKLLVVSPGPGTPARAGCIVELLRRLPEGIAVLGVCLGHQALVEALGGSVGGAGEIIHGKSSLLPHDGTGLFAGIASPMMVGRYHSLAATRVPPDLAIVARLGEIVMAVQHRSRPIWGVQFHPESILTPMGGRLLDNVLAMSTAGRGES
ncbi:MAG: aminodeoxychorismate/anthranilate synthase component II [Candidatus Eisenbacteria bacterium]|nr:aminodeoxychorismate/anthranilate synthase component II [Candidatus Eisenbacteria bacterium]